MKKTIILTALIAGGQVLCAQSPINKNIQERIAEIRNSSVGKAPSYIEFKSHNRPSVEEFFAIKNKLLGLGTSDNLLYYAKEEDQIGQSLLRYTQTYKGYPVEYSRLHLHTKEGAVLSMNATIFTNIQTNIEPTLSEDEALKMALHHYPSDLYAWQDKNREDQMKKIWNDPSFTYYPKAELVILPLLKNGSSTNQFVLSYKFNIYSFQPLKRAMIYVDANTGKIVLERNQLHNSDLAGKAMTRYSGERDIMTTYNTARYILNETGRGNGIHTLNANHLFYPSRDTLNKTSDFFDLDNYWDNKNADQDEVATDAHWATEMVYDYYKKVCNRNSLDDQGLKLISFVHVSESFDNAFWDGESMNYGDGEELYPLTAIDICGHEMTHGLTQYTANLDYEAESGALNESFSDIFGETIEHYARPEKYSFICGKDVFPPEMIPWRDISNPNQGGCPDTYNGLYWDDYNDVHYNSGVQNFWYYVLVHGGVGTNDLGNSYAVPSIGFEKAGAIAYRTLTTYLTPTSDYEEARFFSLKATEDIYGKGSPEYQSVTNAWYAVGFGIPYSAGPNPEFKIKPINSTCISSGITCQFQNYTVDGTSYSWDFGDGYISFEENPTHSYKQNGSYIVKLTASNANSASQISKKIDVGGSLIPAKCIPVTKSNQEERKINAFMTANNYLDFYEQNTGEYMDINCRTVFLPMNNSFLSLSLYLNNSSNNFARIWIDYNNDGQFGDDESILDEPSLNRYEAYADFKIPSHAVKNTFLRMRLMSGKIGSEHYTSCDELTNAQAIDVSVMIEDISNGIANYKANEIKVYPNPATSIIHVILPERGRQHSLCEVYNSLGQQVISKQIEASTEFSLDMSDLPEGVYILRLNTDSEILNQKIMLTR